RAAVLSEGAQPVHRAAGLAGRRSHAGQVRRVLLRRQRGPLFPFRRLAYAGLAVLAQRGVRRPAGTRPCARQLPLRRRVRQIPVCAAASALTVIWFPAAAGPIDAAATPPSSAAGSRPRSAKSPPRR